MLPWLLWLLAVQVVQVQADPIKLTLLKELFQSEALFGPLALRWQLSLGLTIIAFVALLPRGLIGLPAVLNRRGTQGGSREH